MKTSQMISLKMPLAILLLPSLKTIIRLIKLQHLQTVTLETNLAADVKTRLTVVDKRFLT